MAETAPPANSVEALLTAFLDHLNHVPYVRYVFETHGLPEVVRDVLAILCCGECF